jgi:hypothetical protein
MKPKSTLSQLPADRASRFRVRTSSLRHSPHASALPLLLTMSLTLGLAVAFIMVTAFGGQSAIAIA